MAISMLKTQRHHPKMRLLLMAGILLGLVACTGGGGSDVKTPSTPAPTASAPPTSTPSPSPTATPTPTPIQKVYGAEFTVSPNGLDTNPGTPDKPIKSLEKVRDTVRALIAKGVPAGGIAVWLKGGVYERTASLELGPLDSGTSEANAVEWRAVPGETVRISGGRKLDASKLIKVTSSSPIWGRLDASAQGQVVQIDLKAQGITDYGTLRQRGFGKTERAALELFIDAAPMWLARYPDVDAHEPSPSITGNEFTLYGSVSPDVAGLYSKYKVEDGVSAYKRTVGGKDFMLHRTVAKDATTGEAGWRWYLNTSASQADAVWWSDIKAADDTPRHFYGNNKTTGMLTGVNPAAPFHGYLNTTAPIANASFTYAGDRPSRWVSAPDPWVDGFWSSEWEEQHYPITIDTASRQMTLKGAPAGFVIYPHQPWFAYNLLEEITQPGEWYLDRTAGILYLWPPNGFNAASDVVVSTLEAPLVNLQDASHVHFQDLTLETSRFRLIQSVRGNDITLDHVILRNSGGSSAEMKESVGTRLSHCTILNSGHAAIWLTGGDRKNLIKSNNVIEDCDISTYGRFQASGIHGIYLEGCGAIVRHNRIHDAPDRAIGYGGNDHLIELNELDHLCLLCADAAAIYTGGWSTRGCKVKNNFIHHVRSTINGSATHGLYVDECGEGAWSEGNIFYEVGGAAHKYGCRDNVAINNLIVKCGSSLWTDDWGLDRAQPTSSYANYITDLNALGYQQEPWASRYPECAKIPNTWTALIQAPDTWLTPRNCTFARNVVWQESPGWIFRLDLAKNYFNDGLNLDSNNLRNQDPLFVDEAGGDLTLKPSSPAFTLPGFQAIPFQNIGIRK